MNPATKEYRRRIKAKIAEIEPCVLQKEAAIVEGLQLALSILDDCEKRDTSKPYWQNYEGLRALQAMMYLICLGGAVGSSNAHRPKGNYVDTRSGYLSPKKQRDYRNRIRAALIATAEGLGLDPENLPDLPEFHQIES